MEKTVLITGSSSGLGRVAAKHFAENGWNVVATMRRPEGETELATLDDVLLTRLDVQDRASMDAAIHAGTTQFGRIEPGGVASTNFSKRLGVEGSQTAQIADYASFAKKTDAVFAGLRSNRQATEEDVARVILQAAICRYCGHSAVSPRAPGNLRGQLHRVHALALRGRRSTRIECCLAGMR